MQDQNIKVEPAITSNERSDIAEAGKLHENAEINNNMSSKGDTTSHSTPLNESEILKTESAVSEENKELVLDFLPDRPVPVESTTSIDFLGVDPPLESLGLASWWPPGRMQYFMEMLHSGTGLDLSWLQTIIISKLI